MEKGANVNYTLSFNPVNFETDMELFVRFPRQITFENPWNETVGCIGVKGTNTKNLTCKLDRASNTVTVIDAFNKVLIRP